jgi:UDPglucose 6-dehydrogenase
MHDLVLSVVGLGKLGCPMLVCLADCGHRVIGVDINERCLELIRIGRAPVPEPHVEEFLQAHRARISVTRDHAAAVRESGMTFITVPTPSGPDGTFSLTHVQAVCEQVGDALRRKPTFHVVVVTSTVLPEDMETCILPVLEDRSTKRCGRDFGLCYSPEFVALGRVVHDLRHPDFALIGESDEVSGAMLEGVCRRLSGDDVPVVRTNFVNAELAKLAVNTFVTTKISYGNMLAEVCERLPGCDVDVVTSAVGLDSRIGSRYLQGRLGYGGPCFPRDNVAFSAMARRRGVEATLAAATDAVNRRQVVRLCARIRGLRRPGERVGILGLAYKPNTDVVEASQGLLLAAALTAEGFPVTVYDPLGLHNARSVLGDTVEYATSVSECIDHANVVVIATPCEEFKRLQPSQFAHNPRRSVLDCWRIFPPDQINRAADYVTLGKHTEGGLNREGLNR